MLFPQFSSWIARQMWLRILTSQKLAEPESTPEFSDSDSDSDSDFEEACRATDLMLHRRMADLLREAGIYEKHSLRQGPAAETSVS